MGQYALGNIIYYPVENVMMVAELQYGNRENFGDYPTRKMKMLEILFEDC